MDHNNAVIAELGKMRYAHIEKLLKKTRSMAARELPSRSQLQYFKQYVLVRSISEINGFLQKKIARESSGWYNKKNEKCMARCVKDELLHPLRNIDLLTSSTTLWGRKLAVFFIRAQVQSINVDDQVRGLLFGATMTNFIDRMLLPDTPSSEAASKQGGAG